MCARFPIPSTSLVSEPRRTFDINKLDRVAIATAQNCDIFYGGMSVRRNSQRAEPFEIVWRAYLRTGMQQFLSVTLLSLDNMGRGGKSRSCRWRLRALCDRRSMADPAFREDAVRQRAAPRYQDPGLQHGKQIVCAARSRRNHCLGLAPKCASRGRRICVQPGMRIPKAKRNVLRLDRSEIDAVLARQPVERFKQAYGVSREAISP